MQYNRVLAGRTSAEVFVDVFNVADNQGSIRDQDLVAGLGSTAFGDPIQWIRARRAFIGARIRF